MDSLALANAKMDFQDALKRFRDQSSHDTYTKRALRRDKSGTEALSFRGLKGIPKFHSKAKGYFSYTTNCQYPNEKNKLKKPTIRLEGDMLYLPKIKEGIRLIVHRKMPKDAVIGNVTISMDTDGKLYASISYTYTRWVDFSLRQAAMDDDTSMISRLKFLGLDYSQPDFYVDSEGRKANYPHYYKKSEDKLARLQKQLSRMDKDSSHYKKKLAQIQKLHVKIRNQRKDFLQKLSTQLVREYDVIVVEDINLRAMAQCLNFGKNTNDNGFGMFRDMLSYKLENKGSILVKVDKWFPSTKRCSECGYVNSEVTLSVSEWICPHCGAVHIRDDNAAVNIRGEGERIFLESMRQWIAEDEAARKRTEALKAARKNKKKAAKAA